MSCLSLRDNLIDKISPHAFNDLPNLLYLDLSKNRLAFCDLLTFGDHHKLRTLIVDENEPPGDSVPRAILRSDYFPKLEHLYLRKNLLGSLQFSLRSSFPKLTHLYLSDNYITSDNCIRDLPLCLNYLHLERNRIQDFGGPILQNLLSIFLDGNQIRSVCNRHCNGMRLYSARKLKFLSLAKNEISRIESDAFIEASELVSLNLAHNRINHLSGDVFNNLLLLQDLSLEDNQLQNVPDLSRNRLLTSLSLAKNEIRVLETGSFRDLRKLMYLYLNGNQIHRIECDAFSNLISLEELDLSNNKLDHLPVNWFRPQISLKRLDVRGNYFTCLEHLSLTSASYLANVYLENNPVTTVKLCSERYHSWFAPDVVIYLNNGCRLLSNPCNERCLDEYKLSYYYKRRFDDW